MNREFESALAELRLRRAALRDGLAALRQEASPARLADAALQRLDPDFRHLYRLARRVARNKLLTLAVVAGAGWLAGIPRYGDGEAPAARKAGTAPPRANPKEKKNDSGQHQHRKQRPVPRAGQQRQEPRPKAGPQAERRRYPCDGHSERHEQAWPGRRAPQHQRQREWLAQSGLRPQAGPPNGVGAGLLDGAQLCGI